MSGNQAPAPADPSPAAPDPPAVATVDAAALRDLQERARRSDEALAARAREQHQALAAAAVGDGRIPPARREAWVKLLEADTDSAQQALASLPKGHIPVGEPIGHSGGIAEADDPLYTSIFGKGA
jgi:hypothetical protein